MTHTIARRTSSPRTHRFIGATTALLETRVNRSAASWAPSLRRVLRRRHGGTATRADGALPRGVTVFDDRYPGIANLDPALRHALRAAATAAAREGITFYVTSGWRSATYQDQLRREAVATYGSEAEAARWVATADTSAHVSGDAIDIGFHAQVWLSEHGAEYGLCPVYRNEPWHYELRPETIEHGCSALYPDPAHDPRMQR